jgi:hypothetical protein
MNEEYERKPGLTDLRKERPPKKDYLKVGFALFID